MPARADKARKDERAEAQPVQRQGAGYQAGGGFRRIVIVRSSIAT